MNICNFSYFIQQVRATGLQPQDSLSSLFTDLDPLGSGKSKPFVDKKDFFNDSKAKLRLTGASEDSLENVGLSLSESLFEPNICCGPESAYTNSVLSASYLSSSPSSRYCPPDSSSVWAAPRPRYAASNTLRVALPPEQNRPRRPSSPRLAGQQSNTYGSILELEASPRRYRASPPHSSDYDSFNLPPMPMEPPPALPQRPPKLAQHSPPPLPPKKQAVMSASVNMSSSQYQAGPPEMTDLYDFIPEPPSRSWEGQQSQQDECDLAVQDLIKLSVVELSQQLTAGRLPPHLSGMSLFELVEFVGKQTQLSARSEDSLAKVASPVPASTPDIRPSFSDNFVAAGAVTSLPPPVNNLSTNKDESQPHSSDSDSFPQLPPTEPPPGLSPRQDSVYSSLGSRAGEQPESSSHCRLQPAQPDRFEDDFSSSFRTSSPVPPPTCPPGPTAATESAQQPYDKYAVFRELQMEEEIAMAWKSPTEENSGFVPEVEEESPEAVTGPPDEQTATFQSDLEPVFSPPEEEQHADTETDHQHQFFIPKVCSSEGSPCSRSDSGSRKSVSEEEHSDPKKIEVEEIQVPLSDWGDGTKVQICDNDTVIHEIGNENTAFEDNFPAAFDMMSDPAVARDSSAAWTTFEDDKSCEFSTFLSKDDQEKILSSNKSSLFRSDSGRQDSYKKFTNIASDPGYESSNAEFPAASQETDSGKTGRFSLQSPKTLRDLPTTASFQARYKNFKRFEGEPSCPALVTASQPGHAEQLEADWEPAFYRRARSTDPEPGWQLGRPWRESGTPARELEEAWTAPCSAAVHPSQQSSSRGSTDSIANNPFADNFVVTNRSVSATPPAWEGEANDRLSTTSENSAAEFGEATDVFETQHSFTNSGFKVQAKTTKLPNSESVDIFAVSADPFDDEFFK